jgi:DNA polymerase elongation subunit (family B)
MNIKFNIIDWDSYHLETSEDAELYTIRLFGKTSDEKTVFVQVNNFTPFFYVSIPSNWQTYHVSQFIDTLNNLVDKKYKKTIIAHEIVERKKFMGFTNNKLFKYLRLVFNNDNAKKEYIKQLNKRIVIKAFGNRANKYELNESNIDPILRCMHIRNIDPCGWVQILEGKYEELDDGSICDINISTNWINLDPVEDTSITKFIIASYDLECTSEDGSFPQASRNGDKIIQIGTTFNKYGSDTCYYKHLITLGTCDKIDGVEVESYETEIEVLIAWKNLIERINPDIITGYNIFGFDEKYLYNRSKKLGCANKFHFLNRTFEESNFITKELKSAALGDNLLHYYNTIGRVKFDLFKVIQRDYKLSSYKLDAVAGHFIKEKILHLEYKDEKIYIHTSSIKSLQEDSYIAVTIDDGLTESQHNEGQKFRILQKMYNCICVDGDEEDYTLIKEYFTNPSNKIYWTQAKDDIKPNDIFRLQKGTASDRAIIGKYCIKDCELVNILIAKLDIITNNIAMANVCSVPLNYIFVRGQGIKIFSLVAKKCRKKGYIIPVIQRPWRSKEEQQELDDNKKAAYEGAYVFEPKAGVYFEPITVLDFKSLYPSAMIGRNLSHEKILFNGENDNLPNTVYHDIIYDNTQCDNHHCTTHHCINVDCKIEHPIITCNISDCKEIHCKTHCQFSQEFKDGKQVLGIIPEILDDLLNAREYAKQLMKKEKDVFKQNIFNGLQLAYKITANSLYGQTGSEVSQIALKHIAACTTATGKELLRFSQTKIEQKYKGADVIYGDTDSVFVKFKILDEEGKVDTSHKALVKSIELGKHASEYMNSILPFPHNLEYEKVYWPFAIISKKRYVGNLYGENPNKYYQNSMGIVLKRRDNANIVKEIVGNIVHKILNERDINRAIEFTRKSIKKLLDGKYNIDKFIITKTLKQEYKNPDQIAHKVLADRMGIRDPGNKPQPNDRIPFVYVEVNERRGKVILQGERVEHPQYIKEKNLKIDYLFYLTNQIMKPALQFLELMNDNADKIFAEYINKEENKRKGLVEITKFFTSTKVDKKEEKKVLEDKKDTDPFKNYYIQEFDMFNKKADKRTSIVKKSKSKSKSKTINYKKSAPNFNLVM